MLPVVNIKSFGCEHQVFLRSGRPSRPEKTHKPEKVRGRRTLSSLTGSHLQRKHDISHLIHVHTSRFNKSLHRKSTKSQDMALSQNKNIRQPRVETFSLLLQATTQPAEGSPLISLMEAHHIYFGPATPPKPYPIS